MDSDFLFKPGHTACAGCGQAIGARLVIDAAGSNTIVVNNTGCLEVFTTRYPESTWNVPWIHSLFENAAAVASGIEAALIYLGKKDDTFVIAQAGDGGTADIGLQALSGMLERGHDILYVCYDNEAYMNCLSLDSLIMTKDGLKKITEIKVGEGICAFDQKTHKLVFKRCTGVFDNGRKQVFKLDTLHHSIKATANHPFLVLKRNGRGRKNHFVWKTLEEIKIGDEVVVLKNFDMDKSDKFNIEMAKLGDYKVNKLNQINIPESSSIDLMKYLGLFLGDGWCRSERGEVGFAIPTKTQERDILPNLHTKIFGNSIRTDDQYVYINSVNLTKFIDSFGFGKGAKNKTIPGWIFTLPKEQKESFVQGLMLSDGYQTEGSMRYASSSFNLLKRLRLLLQTMGYRVGKIHEQTKKKGTLCVYRELLEDSTYGYICFSKRRDWNVKKYLSQYRYQNFLIENKYFETEKIRRITPMGIEPTLDLRVEDEHNFIADGIVVHNTGVQRSGLTPFETNTTTSPVGSKSFGNIRPKKPMPEIANAHGIPYVATASAGFPQDLQRKVKKAISFKGPKYIQIHVPCPLGWRHETNLTYEIARLAVDTGLYPLIEYENGKLAAVRKITQPKPVEEYLKLQGRFRHLLDNPEELKKIQEIADNNISKYNLRTET
jgi:pyruvate/2-oxoacid:ferredoxin oxidoreductase beta subunit/intein/homing endonuclease